MALWSTPLLLVLLVVVCSAATEVSSGYGNNEELLSLKKIQWRKRGEKRNCLSQKSRTKNGATTLELKHRDSCSKQTTTNRTKKLKKQLTDDSTRVDSIQSQIKTIISSQSTNLLPSKTQIPVSSGIKLQTLNYIVTITLGGRNLTLIVDTGSDLTWVQCQPCRMCYTQPEPLFNPFISPSYQSIKCHSKDCQDLQSVTENYAGLCRTNNPTCNYVVTYGDGSYTRGELGRDKLLLGSTFIDSFVFGCGRNNKGLFGAASGLIGLGRSDLSLVSQTSDRFGGVFSYCLPDSDSDNSGSLTLGNEDSVYKNLTPFSYTSLSVSNPRLSSFYILNMTGASVGGVYLKSPSFGKIGILIDSGTVITRFPPSIYNAVKDEFLKQFSGYNIVPGFSILDTCFNLTGYAEVNIPTLKLMFEGDGEMVVDVSGMFYFVKRDASQVCMALTSLAYEDEMGIIGNYQQKNTRVVYDTKGMRVGFAKENCNF